MSRLLFIQFFFVFLFSKFGLIISSDFDSSLFLHSCGPNKSNDSNLNTSLNMLFSNLTYIANRSNDGSATTTVNVGSQYQLNGLIMCYIDSSQDHCSQCLSFSLINATKVCPGSSNATFTYGWCFLRYSPDNFLANTSTLDRQAYIYGTDEKSNSSTLINTVSKLMNSLMQKAIFNSNLYAYDNTTDPGMNQSVYGVVQCSKDLSKSYCLSCLQYATGNLTDYMRGYLSVGIRVSLMSCYIRYELYNIPLLSFKFIALAPAAGPPSPVLSTPNAGSSETNKHVAIAVLSAFGAFFALSVAGVCFWRKLRPKKIRTSKLGRVSENEQGESTSGSPVEEDASLECGNYRVFPLSKIKSATKNFLPDNKLGEGGFGSVYKGSLHDGQEIAVKKLSKGSMQGYEEFKAEVEFLAKLKHKNLVKLVGYCTEKNEKLLCYEYLPNKSLDRVLFANGNTIRREMVSWQTRYKIIEGISSGLQYLHIDSGYNSVHRDLKPSNILLDKDMNPKIADFGLARFFNDDETHRETSKIAGTNGYMAPEYLNEGHYSDKSDVYSFGVLLLEVVTGKKHISFCKNPSDPGLIKYVLEHWEENQVEILKDPALVDADPTQLSICIEIGLLCVKEDPKDRPNMKEVNLWLQNNSIPIKENEQGESASRSRVEDASLECISRNFQVLLLSEIKSATKDFSQDNRLGGGGFGSVYKGLLHDGREIAVKKLSEWSRQGFEEFKAEVELLAKLKHKNLVKLVGYCTENNEKLLCYEYLPNTSLDRLLFANDHTIRREKLTWQTRYKIIEGISSGLQYLHIDSGYNSVHRDLKPSNILLDKDMNPKIADFGLARFFNDDETHRETSKIAGTNGYMAPEYVNGGHYSDKSDVYSFGVFLLEVVTGRMHSSFCKNPSAPGLIKFVSEHWERKEVGILKDAALVEADPTQLSRCIEMGLFCVKQDPKDRPTMKEVNLWLQNNSIPIKEEDASLERISRNFQVLLLSEIKSATKDFSQDNRLGGGGFGSVYKGILHDGREIAVKKLSEWSRQGFEEFKAEVELLAKLKHKNLVKLVGYCTENNEKLLCYEYLPNKSLDRVLFVAADDNTIRGEKLSWQIRYKIIEGISSGLQYLHIDSGYNSVHRDLKPSNILLDKDMKPKIADFGLARFFEDDETHRETSKIAGTNGYMAPEYANGGHYSDKSDVYSFGVLLFEVVTGKKHSSFCRRQSAPGLIKYVTELWKRNQVEILKDPALVDTDPTQLSRCIKIGLLCVEEDPKNRPNMKEVYDWLHNDSMPIKVMRRQVSQYEDCLTSITTRN